MSIEKVLYDRVDKKIKEICAVDEAITVTLARYIVIGNLAMACTNHHVFMTDEVDSSLADGIWNDAQPWIEESLTKVKKVEVAK